MPLPCGSPDAIEHRAARSPACSPLPQLLTQLIHRRRMEVRAVVAGDRVEVAEAEPISGLGVGRAEVGHGGRLGDEVAAVQCRGWR